MRVPTIVAGYDGSDNARKALDVAADLVTDDGVIHVVTAYDLDAAERTLSGIRSLPEEFQNSFDLLAIPQARLAEAEQMLASRGRRHEAHLVEGHPAAAILDVAEAEGAGMIVVGSRGYGLAARFLRGSVSSRIANHAKTSFLVVHDD